MLSKAGYAHALSQYTVLYVWDTMSQGEENSHFWSFLLVLYILSHIDQHLGLNFTRFPKEWMFISERHYQNHPVTAASPEDTIGIGVL